MAVNVNEQDIATVRLEFKDSNQNTAFNLLHYRLREVSVPGGGLFQGEDWAEVGPALAEAAFTLLKTGWQAQASFDARMTGVSVQSIHPAPRSRMFTHTAAQATTGIIEDEMLPFQDAPTILKRSAFGERWGMGRLFVAGLPESSQVGGIMTAGAVIAANNWAGDLATEVSHVTNGNTFFWRPVLFARDGLNPGVPRVTELVTIDLSDPILKTQRRRRPGKGI